MIKAVIFDLDGTLCDSLKSICYACNIVLEMNGFGARELEEYRYFVGDGADTLIRRALAACLNLDSPELVDEKVFTKVYADYQREFEKYCTYEVKPYDGIKECLAKLKKNGLRLCVLSNKDDERVKQVIGDLFDADTFDIVAGKKENVAKKPSGEGAINIAKELGVTSKECLYVGDTNVDMLTGINAGMTTIGVLWGFRDLKELKETNMDCLIAEKPADIVTLYKSMCK